MLCVIIMELESLRVSSTVVVISKDMKVLIVQRPPNKSFANLWGIAGGKLQSTDGTLITSNLRYFSTEACAVRELREETGISVLIKDLKYLCSLYTDVRNLLVLSYYVILDKDADEIEIKMDLSECQAHRWINRGEIKNYDFILDIGGEISEVFDRVNFENFKRDC